MWKRNNNKCLQHIRDTPEIISDFEKQKSEKLKLGIFWLKKVGIRKFFLLRK